jgi:hypothetical protein
MAPADPGSVCHRTILRRIRTAGKTNTMKQSRAMSLVEALANLVAG